jgi:hypothetical protein
MKTKTWIFYGFLILLVSCSNSGNSTTGNATIDNGLPLPNYQTALAECRKASCPDFDPAQDCPQELTNLQTPSSGAYGMTQACGEAQAAVVLTCGLPYCFSETDQAQEQRCADGYLNKIKALCTPPLPSVEDALTTCKATQCTGKTNIEVSADCMALSQKQNPAVSQACNNITNATALICYSYSNSAGQNCSDTAALESCMRKYKNQTDSVCQ